ncbi:tubulointerstitial nephritis antigen-like isoform X2 [Callorhinchus milii]|uniref:tubulointerstitial nephritis antigen-like isoform X2 n=1 Tax=Callorhinchus milii TaxID=7868 RepID=UPI000457188F|nr:tubulointerstitial nephritis antigen-like isoform X2 [Callorhinchus milii]|eukprot:gi/632976715/ref/XP_007904950.1/ PREDICTED: tubulointerstitial nephritis antigen-like isoform X2 [Callorhinchus milii]
MVAEDEVFLTVLIYSLSKICSLTIWHTDKIRSWGKRSHVELRRKGKTMGRFGKYCERHGQRYPAGATYKDNCNLCTCSDGQWSCDQYACLINHEMIDGINRGHYGWTASNYSQFWGMTLEEGIRYRLGTMRPSATVMNMNQLNVHMERNELLPRYFNAADKWPGMIHEPMDQGNCAASWAFSTAAVASDRISIHSMGHMSPVLSPQNLISCDTRNQQGCDGGRIDGAWWYLRRRGVVTNNCYPFSSTDNQPLSPQCMMSTRSAGRGKRQATMPCPNPYSHSNEVYQSTPAYRLSTNEKEIMKELMENGPVQALMEVHEDFFVYRSGIYRHVPVMAGAPENHRRHGTHSVRITGWGEQLTANGEMSKYWIAANSWGRNWGEGGYFKIARGENECDIEMFIVGTWGRVSMEDMYHK